MRLHFITAFAASLLLACAPEASRNAGEAATSSISAPPARVDVQAISLLGDTLRTFPLAPDVRARYEGQLAAAESAYLHTPTNVDSIIWFGRRLAYLGRLREAIEVFSRGIALAPENPWLYRHRGHRYISVRDFDRAIDDLERAATLVSGRPDEVEPDGQPNAQNTPIGTLHSNIDYHLALAHYLKGDFADALPVYERDLANATNDDRRVSVSHWYYMSLRRLGRDREAAAVLAPITGATTVIENDAYLRLVQLYKGARSVDSVLSTSADGAMSVQDATAAYGVANWHQYNGRQSQAEALYRRIVAGGQWGSFGYIASEAELARLRGR